ncbi:hypothetical protein [Sphingosinithalassobacter sp. CS137]|uniref:hypothetical protein n=1 Tax=Sphingosinithalassobacter sp. CS137 TaxID=2762748 RepID=UPI00165E56A0|nr:hypothetical protein [Sphingosinithalassobacter sp. CS137]
MNDIDSALQRLAKAPPPTDLDRLEAAVFERVEGHGFGQPHVGTPLRICAVALAVALGIVGGLIPNRSGDAESFPVPLSDAARFAPSTLLIGHS